jgi:hypothetical protein
MTVLAEHALGRGGIEADVAAFTTRLRDLAWPAAGRAVAPTG